MNQEVFEQIIKRLKKDEGFRAYVYRCPAGYLTIGYGHNCETTPLSTTAADFILREDVRMCINTLSQNCPEYNQLITSGEHARAAVLVDMCFNLGWYGLSGFRKLFKALRENKYDIAAQEILNSNYAKQNRVRAKRNADIMRTGKMGDI